MRRPRRRARPRLVNLRRPRSPQLTPRCRRRPARVQRRRLVDRRRGRGVRRGTHGEGRHRRRSGPAAGRRGDMPRRGRVIVERCALCGETLTILPGAVALVEGGGGRMGRRRRGAPCSLDRLPDELQRRVPTELHDPRLGISIPRLPKHAPSIPLPRHSQTGRIGPGCREDPLSPGLSLR